MKHDSHNAGITVGEAPYTVHIEKLEYADNAAFTDDVVDDASTRVTAISH